MCLLFAYLSVGNNLSLERYLNDCCVASTVASIECRIGARLHKKVKVFQKEVMI